MYDYITDSDLKKGLEGDLDKVNINKDFTQDDNNVLNAFSKKDIHVLRISKLIRELKEKKPLTPITVSFDKNNSNNDIKNFIDDGNHRIRALQYLNYDGFPAYIYGSHEKYLINYLKINYKQ